MELLLGQLIFSMMADFTEDEMDMITSGIPMGKSGRA